MTLGEFVPPYVPGDRLRASAPYAESNTSVKLLLTNVKTEINSGSNAPRSTSPSASKLVHAPSVPDFNWYHSLSQPMLVGVCCCSVILPVGNCSVKMSVYERTDGDPSKSKDGYRC